MEEKSLNYFRFGACMRRFQCDDAENMAMKGLRPMIPFRARSHDYNMQNESLWEQTDHE